MSAQARPPVETYYDGIASGLTTVRRELAGLGHEVDGLGGALKPWTRRSTATRPKSWN